MLLFLLQSTLHDAPDGSWQRRDLTITDDMQTISLKLWRNAIKTCNQINIGDKVQIVNVSVHHFGQTTSLNSTPQTRNAVCYLVIVSTI